jgi:uncharacterized surface protein with fasciclin (FAS1) repeats
MLVYLYTMCTLFAGNVMSTSLRRLRQQEKYPETVHYDTYERESLDENYLELWHRWLQADLSMKTKAPVASTTRKPTKSPVRPPSSSIPINMNTKLPVAPKQPVPSAPGSLPSVTLAPVALPPATLAPAALPPVTRAPIVAPIPTPIDFPSTSPSFSPSTMPSNHPVTLSPQTLSPVTKLPTTRAPVTQPPTTPVGTLLQLLQTVPELSTLLTAITTSDANRNMPPYFTEIFNNSNTSITIFAPVNTGFNNLENVVPGYLTQLLTPDFGLHLFEILAYHGTQGIVTTATFPRMNLRMLAGGNVTVTAPSNTSFEVQSFSTFLAQILPPPDVRATNGLVQVVNNVLLPEFVFLNLFEGIVRENSRNGGQFTTLLRLVTAAGLEAILMGTIGATLLAPINSGIPSETEQFLLQPGNEAILSDVVRYHVLTELFNFAAEQNSTVQLYDTLLQGARVVAGVVVMQNGGVFVQYNQAIQLRYTVVKESLIYTVDRILIPPLLRPVIPGGPPTNSTLVSSNDLAVGETSGGITSQSKKKMQQPSSP